MKSGIYRITNKMNRKIYIGSAVNLTKRITNHLWRLENGSHANCHLQAAWKKYGCNAFSFDVVLICSKQNLLLYEQLCIDAFIATESIYNICRKAGSSIGTKRSLESRAKMAIAGKNKVMSSEHIAKIVAANKNREYSAEFRANVAARFKGNTHNKGKKQPSHVIEKRRAAQIGELNHQFGKPHTNETKAKMAAAMTGRKASLETKAKMSAARSSRYLSPENCAITGVIQ